MLSTADLDSLIAELLSAEKTIRGKMSWKSANRADYSVCKFRVISPSVPRSILYLILTAEKRHLPQKAGFALLLGSHRIFALDVEPRRWHRNRKTLGSIGKTHWHSGRDGEAEADDRIMTHRDWFTEFLLRSRIVFTGQYRKPPYEPEQMVLL